MTRVLVVDDDRSIRRSLEKFLGGEGYDVATAGDGAAALAAVAAVEVVLLDLGLPGADGLDVLAALRARPHPPAVVVITARDDMASTVRAIQLGAYEYLVKPLDIDRLRLVVQRAAASRNAERALGQFVAREAASAQLGNLIGKSPAIRDVWKQIGAVSTSKTTVLLLGESGTGKELVAKAIHYASAEREQPFVAINCTAFAPGVLESELFGHVKGAFTGAVADKAGRFELAGGGTLFLDEIGELPLELQAKLLRVLQVGDRDVGVDRALPARAAVAAGRHLDDRVVQEQHVALGRDLGRRPRPQVHADLGIERRVRRVQVVRVHQEHRVGAHRHRDAVGERQDRRPAAVLRAADQPGDRPAVRCAGAAVEHARGVDRRAVVGRGRDRVVRGLVQEEVVAASGEAHLVARDPHRRGGRLHELAPLALDAGRDAVGHRELHALAGRRRRQAVVVGRVRIGGAGGAGGEEEGERERQAGHVAQCPQRARTLTAIAGAGSRRADRRPPAGQDVRGGVGAGLARGGGLGGERVGLLGHRGAIGLDRFGEGAHVGRDLGAAQHLGVAGADLHRARHRFDAVDRPGGVAGGGALGRHRRGGGGAAVLQPGLELPQRGGGPSLVARVEVEAADRLQRQRGDQRGCVARSHLRDDGGGGDAGVAHRDRALAVAVRTGPELHGALVVTGGVLDRESLQAARLLADRLADACEHQRLRTRLDEARQLAALGAFAAAIAHDIRTPLTSVQMNVQILRGKVDLPADDMEYFDIALAELRRLDAHVRELLDYAKPLQLRRETVDVREIADDAARTVAAVLDERGQTLARDHAGDLPAIAIDAPRVRQVVWNLLSNAIKFTPRGGQVQVTLRKVHSQVHVQVSDTGAGIAPELVEHVFDRFRQGDASTTRRHGGLGLGLSIVKSLVELHGGSVEAASDGEQTGATFTVRLSLALASTQRDSQVDLPSGDVSITTSLAGLRVLVLDDEEDARDVVTRLLEEAGAAVTAAGSASDAQKLLEDGLVPDVVVSDVGMPERDGYDFIQAVRRMPPPLRTVPAVALTALARLEDRKRALLSGFQTHLAKPVDPAELVATVASLAGRTGRT